MASRCPHPAYTYQAPSGYIFRFRVPEDLEGVVGTSEFSYFLRTGALRVAKHRASCIVSLIHQLFKEVRNGLYNFTSERLSGDSSSHCR